MFALTGRIPVRGYWIGAALLVMSPFAYAGSLLLFEFWLGLAGVSYLRGTPKKLVSAFYAPLNSARRAYWRETQNFESARSYAERSGWELHCRGRSARVERASSRVKISSTGPELTPGCIKRWYCPIVTP